MKRHHGIEPLALDLVRHGLGTRETATVLGVGPSLIAYYRKKAKMPAEQVTVATRESLMDALPDDVEQAEERAA